MKEVYLNNIQEKVKVSVEEYGEKKGYEQVTMYFKQSLREAKPCPEVENSAAYIAMVGNLSDIIGNAYDAGATQLCISFPSNIDLSQRESDLEIFVCDNGRGIPAEMLKSDGSANNYRDYLGGKQRIVSDKVHQKDNHGGAGMGLARSSMFLDQQQGTLRLANKAGNQTGAEIGFISKPGSTDTFKANILVRAFGKIKDHQNKAVAEQERAQLPRVTVVPALTLGLSKMFLSSSPICTTSPGSSSRESTASIPSSLYSPFSETSLSSSSPVLFSDLLEQSPKINKAVKTEESSGNKHGLSISPV